MGTAGTGADNGEDLGWGHLEGHGNAIKRNSFNEKEEREREIMTFFVNLKNFNFILKEFYGNNILFKSHFKGTMTLIEKMVSRVFRNGLYQHCAIRCA